MWNFQFSDCPVTCNRRKRSACQLELVPRCVRSHCKFIKAEGYFISQRSVFLWKVKARIQNVLLAAALLMLQGCKAFSPTPIHCKPESPHVQAYWEVPVWPSKDETAHHTKLCAKILNMNSINILYTPQCFSNILEEWFLPCKGCLWTVLIIWFASAIM